MQCCADAPEMLDLLRNSVPKEVHVIQDDEWPEVVTRHSIAVTEVLSLITNVSMEEEKLQSRRLAVVCEAINAEPVPPRNLHAVADR